MALMSRFYSLSSEFYCTESQNHRTGGVGRDLQRPSRPTPCQSRFPTPGRTADGRFPSSCLHVPLKRAWPHRYGRHTSGKALPKRGEGGAPSCFWQSFLLEPSSGYWQLGEMASCWSVPWCAAEAKVLPFCLCGDRSLATGSSPLRRRVASAEPVRELLSLGNSPVWLEGKGQELNVETTQLSARRDLILQSVLDVLHENGIHGLKGEEILQLTQHAVEKIMENSVWRPNWALKTMGTTVDAERTSESYGGKGWKNHWLPPLFSTAKPPETLLQPDISPGNCWAFSGSRGHVVIRLPEEIQLAALTIWHISEAFSPSGEVSSALREFAVSGVDEASGETLLGLFVYNVDGEIAQTFHLQIWRVRAAGCQGGRRKGLPDQPGPALLSNMADSCGGDRRGGRPTLGSTFSPC